MYINICCGLKCVSWAEGSILKMRFCEYFLFLKGIFWISYGEMLNDFLSKDNSTKIWIWWKGETRFNFLCISRNVEVEVFAGISLPSNFKNTEYPFITSLTSCCQSLKFNAPFQFICSFFKFTASYHLFPYAVIIYRWWKWRSNGHETRWEVKTPNI